MKQLSSVSRAIAMFCLAGLVALGTGGGRMLAQAQAQAAVTPEAAADFIGDWTLDMQGQNGPAVFTLTVKTDAGKVVGEISSDQMAKTAITDVSKSDTTLVLRFTFDYQGNGVNAVVTLKPEGDKVASAIDFADGAYVVSGTATKKK